jgi:2-hydroxychromene-2-carboxylate isomerase
MTFGQENDKIRAAASAILAETDKWQEIMALPGDKVVEVYLDIKSPHAYLAVRPTLMLARDYRVRLNFLPYTLNYVSLGVTTRVQEDMKRRPVDAAAERKARMYYTTARQYAALQRLPLRGPHRLLDTIAANTAFLFAKQQGLEVPFLMRVYVQGWGSGWRNYEVEASDQLLASLREVGADCDGFDAFMAPGGAGEIELKNCLAKAEASGISGVPHYVFHDDTLGRELGLFGREHLTLIRQKLQAAGLARSSGVRPEFSHAWDGTP